jgi:hypothetical protein
VSTQCVPARSGVYPAVESASLGCGAGPRPANWATPDARDRAAKSIRSDPRDDGTVTPVVLIRHAEPLVDGETPGAEWPLTEKGRNDASLLGTSLTGRSASTVVWTSPERRARETAALAFPLVVSGVRDELSEVKKPRYA